MLVYPQYRMPTFCKLGPHFACCSLRIGMRDMKLLDVSVAQTAYWLREQVMLLRSLAYETRLKTSSSRIIRGLYPLLKEH